MRTKKVSIRFFPILIFIIILILILIIYLITTLATKQPEKIEVEINYPFSGEGTQDNPYLIENTEDLIELSSIVNKGNTCKDIYFMLMDNIDFSSIEDYTTIANSNNLSFEGNFNGNEKSIENFNIDISNDETFYGLFGNNKGTIKNLKVISTINFEETVTKNDAYIGLVCAKNNGTIENCKVEGKIQIKINNNDSNVKIAGITAENTGNILNSSSTVEINSNTTKAGICAINSSTITNCNNTGNIQETEVNNVYTAGIVAENLGGVITSCNNSGKIVGQIVAGICANSNGNIISCQNSGVINNFLETNENLSENENSNFLAGGIAGILNTATMENCRNTGEISGVEIIGGVIAKNYGTISQARNEGTISKLEKVTNKNIAVGGIAGINLEKGRIINSKNSGKINSTASQEICIGGICGTYESNSIIEQSENSGTIYAEGNEVIPNEDLTDKCSLCTNTGGGSASKVENGKVYLGLIYGKYQNKEQE